MEISLANEFIYKPRQGNEIYVCKDLQKLLEMSDNHIWEIFAVLDTPQGEKLFELDFAYSSEPIVMRVFMHKNSFLGFYSERKIIKI